MPFQVNYDSHLRCIVTELTGDLDTKVVSSFFNEVGKVAKENQCLRVLSDVRDSKIVASLADLYKMADRLNEKQVTTKFKRAIVATSDKKEYDFWETVCFNQGHQNVKIFSDYEQAKKWILQQ